MKRLERLLHLSHRLLLRGILTEHRETVLHIVPQQEIRAHERLFADAAGLDVICRKRPEFFADRHRLHIDDVAVVPRLGAKGHVQRGVNRILSVDGIPVADLPQCLPGPTVHDLHLVLVLDPQQAEIAQVDVALKGGAVLPRVKRGCPLVCYFVLLGLRNRRMRIRLLRHRLIQRPQIPRANHDPHHHRHKKTEPLHNQPRLSLRFNAKPQLKPRPALCGL